MEKSEIKILIVEDDVNLSKAIHESVKRAGYSPTAVTKPDEALQQSQIQVFNAYLIDCLLPKTPGVELAKKIRDSVGNDVPILLMSGIFKDKIFIKESIAKVNAKAFLEKPFDLNSLIKILDESLSSLIDEVTDAWTELLYRPNSTPNEKLAAISDTKSVHGFDLPRLFCSLMGKDIEGTLSFKDLGDGSVSSVGFSNSNIVKVMVNDPQSFFGALLVEKNFLSAEELELALSTPSPKRIGERLVEANLISPHAIAIINAEQMVIRLSRLIKDTSYEITWNNEKHNTGDSYVDLTLLVHFMMDWSRSKIHPQWIKTHLMPFLENKTQVTGQFTDTHPVRLHLNTQSTESVINKLKEGRSLQDLLQDNTMPEDDVLSIVEVLVSCGLLGFAKESKAASFASQIHRLSKIQEELQKKNLFEILGVSSKSKSSDIKRAYHELAKVFHPDKVSQAAPQELKDLTQSVFSKMTSAYETLSNENKRSDYLKQIEKGHAEKILQSESLLEEAKAALKAGQNQLALEKLKVAISLRPPTAEIILYDLWAKLNLIGQGKESQMIQEIEAGLLKIPPEERHSAIYYFVKGMFQKYTGEIELARRNLEHALSISPAFVEVKRELNSLKSVANNKNVDIFRDDLSVVMSSLFKKRK